MHELIVIGRVARAHGNKGHVIVNPDTDFAEDRFRPGAVVLVGDGERAREIRAARFHRGRPVIALEGIDTMDDAEALAGAELKIPAEGLEPLPANTFYHRELEGCAVRCPDGTLVGTVAAVEGSLEMSRLVIAGARGEILIPLVADICVSIDVRAKAIVVNPPEGLLELNETARTRGHA